MKKAYRIETLPTHKSGNEPVLLNYDSNGVIFDKVVFHADLAKFLSFWKQDGYFISKFDENYN